MKALVKIDKRFDPDYQRILMTVHDSIMIECKLGYEDETKAIMKEEMENWHFDSPLPLKADFKQGFTWGSMKK